MLTLEQITWGAPGGERVLKGVDLSIPDGKLIVVTGPNGGGKTTIAKLIAGLEKPDSGRILLDGEDITGLDITGRARRGISYAFQQPVELAAGGSLSEDKLCEILSRVGLCAREYVDREVNGSLSGGEIKRIEIATVLARHTRISIFDEPEAGIDLWSFSNLISVFQEMRESLDGTLIIISHQERILSIADELVVIADGLVQERGPRDKILPKLLGGEERCGHCPNLEEGTAS